MTRLRILTDSISLKPPSQTANVQDAVDVMVDEDSDVDSLFDEPVEDSPTDILDGIESFTSSYTEPPPPIDMVPASRLGPPIPGLYFDPSILLPDELAETLLQKCIATYFQDDNVNQVMLFERVVTNNSSNANSPGALRSDITLQLEFNFRLQNQRSSQTHRGCHSSSKICCTRYQIIYVRSFQHTFMRYCFPRQTRRRVRGRSSSTSTVRARASPRTSI